MTQANHRLSVTEKVGYSLGDLAANLIFQTLVMFLPLFYTDVYGLSAGAASSVLLIAGLAGAFFNPVMGIIADRTETRWGKFRPWILWTSIPFGVVAILAFTTPDLSPGAKIAYAMVTYLLLVIIYSANNLPYAALSGVLTGSMAERNSLSSYRFVAVMVAQFIIQVMLLPLVILIGGGDSPEAKAEGFSSMITVFAIAGAIMFVITFLTTRERVRPVVAKSRVVDDLKDLARNRPWGVMLAVTVLVFISLALRGGSVPFYFNNYLDDNALINFLSNFGFDAESSPETAAARASSYGLGLFNGLNIIMQIIGIGFSKKLADKYGKRDVYGVALAISTFFVLIFLVLPPDAIVLTFGAQILQGFFYGITVPLLWAMIADVADFSEWRNNRRATAIIFSAMIFGLKAGLSVGGALVTWLLGVYGYNRDLGVQTGETLEGIKHIVSLWAALPFLTAAALLFFYPINKRMENTIESELGARRAANPVAS